MLWTALTSLAGRSRVATMAVTYGHGVARRGGGDSTASGGSLTGPPDLVNEPAACWQARAASAPAAPQGRGYGQRQRPGGARASPGGCWAPPPGCAGSG